jgi:acyl carrier protein
MDTLAQMKRRDSTEMERELRQAGPECPFDSIYLARVAVKVARRLGVKIKPSAKIAQSFKSVDALTTLLDSLAAKRTAA